MKIVDSIARMSTFSRMLKKEGKTIGFVPTMGALHEGHLSLAKTAKKHTDIVVISIFVNPAQFCPGEDYLKYPRDSVRDEELARGAGVDVIFAPSVKAMYPDEYATYVTVDRLTETLCGASRPGHFRGVTTVVTKLFGIVKPDIAYFGQKDAQQATIIKKMVKDLNMDVEIKVLPIAREKDGLAMSSRNRYLSEEHRASAPVIHEALVMAKALIEAGQKDSKSVMRIMHEMISGKQDVKIDYISIVDANDLQERPVIEGTILIAAAVYIGTTRLIDNIVIAVDGKKSDGA